MGPTINYSQVDDGTPPAEFEIATSMPAPKLSFFQRIKQSLINLAFNNREAGRGKPRSLGRVIGRHNTRSNKNDPSPRWFVRGGVWRAPLDGDTIFIHGDEAVYLRATVWALRGYCETPDGFRYPLDEIEAYTLDDPDWRMPK